MEDFIDNVINSRMALKNYNMQYQRLQKLRKNCLPDHYILQDAEEVFLDICVELNHLLKKRSVNLSEQELKMIRQQNLTNLSYHYLSKLFHITSEDPQTVLHVKKNWYKKIYNF